MSRKPREPRPIECEGGTPLDYAHHDTAKAPRGIPRSSVLAVTAIVFQVLWLGFYIFGELAGYFRTGQQRSLEGIGGAIFVWWPTLVAFVFSCYSLRVAGVSLRNVLGVLGFIVSATVIVLGLVVKVWRD